MPKVPAGSDLFRRSGVGCKGRKGRKRERVLIPSIIFFSVETDMWDRRSICAERWDSKEEAVKKEEEEKGRRGLSSLRLGPGTRDERRR